MSGSSESNTQDLPDEIINRLISETDSSMVVLVDWDACSRLKEILIV